MERKIELIWTFMLDYTKGWGVRRHDHDYFQMYYCLDGEGNFYLDGRTIQLTKHDCLIMRPGQVHELYPITKGKFRLIDTKFYIHDNIIFNSIVNMPQIISMVDHSFKEIQMSMREEWASNYPFSKEIANLLFEQALYFFFRYTAPKPATIPFYYSMEQKIFCLKGIEKQISDYLSEHLLEKVSLDHLAYKLKYSKNYLCTAFKTSTGCTISEFYNYLRIRKSYDLVCNTDQKLSEIALLCGFSSIHYFSRIFHKYVGLSPSQVRDSDRNSLYTDIRLHGTFRYRYFTSEE